MENKRERIQTKQQLRQWLQYEKGCYAYLSPLKYWLQNSESAIIWKHQVLLRKTEYHMNSKHPVMSIIMRYRLNMLQNKYSIHIPPNVCGKGLRLMHVGPILINSNASVGDNCVFHINTALVAGGTNHGTPTLGNNVIVGIGAIILGDTHIADGVAIGANAVVNKDVLEENIAVAGVPARKISNNGRFEWNKKVN